ncbi:GDSL-type esterase/lipase family protein [Candidatus Allofournierella excrementigallinarum]|uniref:GDSL-type esterase/lipase family protein n=1 Tax=Candidatus Allofournierella excrementigallinarum TaxID=2838592 RepID=UPI00374F47DF
MPQNRRKSRGGPAPLTPKQKQAAIVLGICALVLIITIVAVSVIVSKAGGGQPDSGSTSQTSSGTSQIVAGGFDASKYGDAVLGETEDAGAEYINETIFVGDSNTYRYYQYNLLDLDQVVAVEGLGIQEFTTDKSIYFKGDDNGYSIPDALAKMKPRRIIVMMGTNNADGTMSASDFASNYRTALEAVKTAYPYTDIIVSAVPPIPEDHSSYASMSMETINEFNDALAQVCADNGYKFLNVSEVLVGDDGYGKSQYFLSGDIHLKKDALTAIMEYARTHAYLGTEDRRPDTDNIPERRKTGSTGTVTATPTPSPDEKTYTAQYNVDKNVGGTLTSGDKKGVTSLSFKDLTSKSSVSVTAVPADGYEFLKWSDGNTNATRTDKDFKQNVNVTAMFGAKLVVSIKEGSSGTTTVGQGVTLHANVSDRSSINVDNDIYWTVNGTEFRRGISAGYTPDKEGTYEIKANVTLNGKTYSATYTLTAKAGVVNPTGITVNGGTTVSSSGGSVTLTATVTPSNAQGTVSWSVTSGATLSATSGSSTTVTVPANNSTSPVTYTVTAKIGNVSGTATITVEGKALQTMNVSISGETNTTTGQQYTYTVNNAPSGATITWGGDVSGSGSSVNFTPSEAKSYTITVTVKADGYTDGTASITVNATAPATQGNESE